MDANAVVVVCTRAAGTLNSDFRGVLSANIFLFSDGS